MKEASVVIKVTGQNEPTLGTEHTKDSSGDKIPAVTIDTLKKIETSLVEAQLDQAAIQAYIDERFGRWETRITTAKEQASKTESAIAELQQKLRDLEQKLNRSKQKLSRSEPEAGDVTYVAI